MLCANVHTRKRGKVSKMSESKHKIDAVIEALNQRTHECVGMTATIYLQENMCPEFENRKESVKETLEKQKAPSQPSICKSRRSNRSRKTEFVKAAVYAAQKSVDLEYFEKKQKLQAELKLLQLQKEKEKTVRKGKVTLELESDSSQCSSSSKASVGSKDNIDRYMKSMKDDIPQGLHASVTEPLSAGLNPEQLDVTPGIC